MYTKAISPQVLAGQPGFAVFSSGSRLIGRPLRAMHHSSSGRSSDPGQNRAAEDSSQGQQGPESQPPRASVVSRTSGRKYKRVRVADLLNQEPEPPQYGGIGPTAGVDGAGASSGHARAPNPPINPYAYEGYSSGHVPTYQEPHAASRDAQPMMTPPQPPRPALHDASATTPYYSTGVTPRGIGDVPTTRSFVGHGSPAVGHGAVPRGVGQQVAPHGHRSLSSGGTRDGPPPPRHSGRPPARDFTAVPGFSAPPTAALVRQPTLVECTMCNLRFPNRHAMMEHRRSFHPKPDFVCSHCQRSYADRGNLNKHIRSVHERRKPFSCSQCSSAFAFSDGLKRHVQMVHLGERPHVCPYCSQAFKQRAHLGKHLSALHPDRVGGPDSGGYGGGKGPGGPTGGPGGAGPSGGGSAGGSSASVLGR